MKLYWAPQTRSSRAIWMLEESELEYDLELVDIRSPDPKHPAGFLDASPMGKVPALVDGDTSMSESAAICLFVADRYRNRILSPEVDDALRGKFLYWLMYTPAVIEPAMSEKFNQVEPARHRSGWGDFDLMIETFEKGIQDREWIIGETFTAADVMLGSSAIFMRSFGMLPDSEAIEAYADRCSGRAAYQRSLEVQENP